MPAYNLYLVGNNDKPKNIFGWTNDNLQGEVYLVSGPYKMISMFMNILLKRKGDVIGRPNEGTDFVRIFEQSFGDAADLQAKLLEILEDAFAQIQDLQQQAALQTTLPANEILEDYNLVDIFVSRDGATAALSVELTNAAGEIVTAPIPTLDLQRNS